jgi:hypothetical protein
MRRILVVATLVVSGVVATPAAGQSEPPNPTITSVILGPGPGQLTVRWQPTSGVEVDGWTVAVLAPDGPQSHGGAVYGSRLAAGPERSAVLSCLPGGANPTDFVSVTPFRRGQQAGGGSQANAPDLPERVDIRRWVERAAAAAKGVATPPEELAALARGVETCQLDRLGVARGLITSLEARVAFAQRLYQEALGRSGDAAGIDYWAGRVNLIEAKATAYFWGSAESVGRYPDLGAWLDAVYMRFLSRAPDAAGRAYWLGFGASRAPSVVQAILQSSEGVTRRTTDLFALYLGRPASGDELRRWATTMRTEGEFDVAFPLLASDEFFARAQAG